MAIFRMLMGASKAERLEARAIRLQGYDARLMPGPAGGAAYTYERAGKLLALFFIGSSAKPTGHYVYSTAEKRAEAITQFHAGLISRAPRKARTKADEQAKPNPYKVGDIVNTSWGYDQTNVDFYIVTRRTASTVWVRSVVHDSEATGFMQERVWPKMPIEMVGEEIMCRVLGGHFSVRGHGASITNGDKYASHYA